MPSPQRMTILILNQTFAPDVQATAQHASDLARELADQGHEVTVLAGRRAYGRPGIVYPAEENWEGVRIVRVGAADFGKQSRWRRAGNFASFLGAAAWRLARMRRFDVTVAMTTPPLVTVLGAGFTRIKGGRFVAWIMDLNPDEAVAAGWLKPRSLISLTLQRLMCWSLGRADTIIVLDRFMRDRVEAKLNNSRGLSPASPAPNAQRPESKVQPATSSSSPAPPSSFIFHPSSFAVPELGDRQRCPRANPAWDTEASHRIVVIPPGARDKLVHYEEAGRREFRRKFGLAGKFVVMYSGNHSPCHPLDTLLRAAERLRDDPRFAFCFIGGGSQFETVRSFAAHRELENIVCLPYQPEEELAASLSAADLHAVVMGDAFVGIVHPSKIYNILTLGIPVLYIGPVESHITDLARRPLSASAVPMPGPAAQSPSSSSSAPLSSFILHPSSFPPPWFFEARHGEVERVVRHILAAESSAGVHSEEELAVAARFRQQELVAELCECITNSEGRRIEPRRTQTSRTGVSLEQAGRSG